MLCTCKLWGLVSFSDFGRPHKCARKGMSAATSSTREVRPSNTAAPLQQKLGDARKNARHFVESLRWEITSLVIVLVYCVFVFVVLAIDDPEVFEHQSIPSASPLLWPWHAGERKASAATLCWVRTGLLLVAQVQSLIDANTADTLNLFFLIFDLVFLVYFILEIAAYTIIFGTPARARCLPLLPVTHGHTHSHAAHRTAKPHSCYRLVLLQGLFRSRRCSDRDHVVCSYSESHRHHSAGRLRNAYRCFHPSPVRNAPSIPNPSRARCICSP